MNGIANRIDPLGIRRKLEMCRKCPRFSRKSGFVRCDVSTYMFDEKEADKWERLEIPYHCEMYAEYLLEHCNEEKIQ